MEQKKYKAALVLSGGGARGAFQFGALEYLHEQGFEWEPIAGISVGALNSTMLSLGQFGELAHLWKTIKRRDVYRRCFNIPTIIFRLPFDSVLSNKPLQKRLAIYEDKLEKDIQKEVRVGAVSLETGDYIQFKYEPGKGAFYTIPPQTRAERAEGKESEWHPISDKAFLQGVLASTVMPIIWKPVTIGTDPKLRRLVDGGVRNVAPMGDIVDSGPELIVIINCGSEQPKRTDETKNIVQILLRIIEDLFVNEILQNDIDGFLNINRLVKQAEAGKVILKKASGKPYKYFDYILIQPDEQLPHPLEFDRDVLNQSIQKGRDVAKREFTKWVGQAGGNP